MLDFLEGTLSPEDSLKFKERPFYDRMERIKGDVAQADYPAKKKAGFETFFLRLDPLCERRNHIAHGTGALPNLLRCLVL